MTALDLTKAAVIGSILGVLSGVIASVITIGVLLSFMELYLIIGGG